MLATDPARLVNDAAEAIITYYGDTSRVPDDELDWQRQAAYSKAQRRRADDAREAVTAALKAGVTVRQIASSARLSGHLIFQFIADSQHLADTYAAEIHHLERTLEQIRQQRIVNARVRFAAGERKTTLADSYGVTRVTLDKWLE